MRIYNKPWTKQEKELVKEFYPKAPKEEILQRLDRSFSAVKTQAQRMGIKRIVNRRTWTEEDDEKMRAFYPTTLTKEMAALLSRSERSIYSRAKTLGLFKDEEFLKQTQDRINKNLAEAGKKHRFKKRQEPPNKGKKMDPKLYRRIKHTFFQKGHNPHNTKEDGDISVRKSKGRPYKWIRIAENEWKLYHRVVWEQRHGKIPKGYNVVFKDGNTLHCAIENLELISDEENMKRNTIHNYPPELKQTLRLQSKIKRIINQKEKDL